MNKTIEDLKREYIAYQQEIGYEENAPWGVKPDMGRVQIFEGRAAEVVAKLQRAGFSGPVQDERGVIYGRI